MTNALRRKQKSVRNVPCCTMRSSSRLEAATVGTSAC